MKRNAILFLLALLANVHATRIHAQGHTAECWMDATTGLWTWGFFNDFAVHEAKTWTYESDRQEGNRRTVVLRNGSERACVDIHLTSDTTCTIATNGQSPLACRRWDSRKGIFAYLPADNTPPVPCTFRQDSTTLRGYWPQAAGQMLSLLYYRPFVAGLQKDSTLVNTSGRFEIRLPLTDNTRILLANQERTSKYIWLTPGNDTFVWLQDAKALAMGKGSRLCNEMLHENFYYASYPTYGLDDSACATQIRTSLHQKHSALDSLSRSHPNLSAAYRHLAEEEISYGALCSLFEQQFHHKALDDGLSPELLALADSLMRHMPHTLTFSSLEHYLFTSNCLSHTFTGHLHGYLRQIKRGLYEQTGGPQIPDSILRRLDHALEMGKNLSKPTAAFRETAYSTIRLISSSHPHGNLLPTAMLRSFWEVADALPLPDFHKEYMKTFAAMHTLDGSHLPMSDKVFGEYLGQIRDNGLRETVSRLQGHYQRIWQEDFDYQGSLKDNALVDGLTDGGEILRRILAPYRGKVVYTDIWGTWCTPCKRDMKYHAPSVKEALEGQDVVFLYFANDSPDNSWKQIIKEYQCVGAQTVHYNLPAAQQEAVERILLSNGTYPSYGLFDKEGRLVTKDAPRPDDKKRLVQMIEKLLHP